MDAVLVVAPFLPYPPDFGGAIRVYELVRHLAQDRQVVVLAPVQDPGGQDFAAIEALGDICDVTAVPASGTARDPAGLRKRLAQLASLARYRSVLPYLGYFESMQHAMDRLFQTRFIDVVLYEFPQTTLYRPPAGTPTVLDAHNIEHQLVRRVALESSSAGRAAFNMLEWRKLRRFEQDAWRSVDLCIATSQQDADLIEQCTGRAVPVIPNGVDIQRYRPRDSRQHVEPRIVFVGAMRHQPNASGAIWMAREIFPILREHIPSAELLIVGADPPPSVQRLAGNGIVVTGRVPDVRPYLESAAVAVVPLHSGGGTRLKILEAFAAGVPVVSTTIGAEGIDAVDGEHLLLADRPEAFAASIQRLLQVGDAAARLSTNARQLVNSRYSWSQITGNLRQVLGEVTVQDENSP